MSLPRLDLETFARRLGRVSPQPLSTRAIEALWAHYEVLAQWGRGMSLIGPGTEAEAVERHYGESLAPLPWIDDERRGRLLDVGSGAGFPGFVIAAARPRLDAWLVESRQRKSAFLRAAAARAALPCRCLNARVAAAPPPEVPEELEFVTLRAVKLPTDTLAALLSRLTPRGALLWWRGAEAPELPAGWAVTRQSDLPGSERRRVVEVRRAA
jgi:16S rRNA (guanine(527)-N(7))-methyltransferase RsmG